MMSKISNPGLDVRGQQLVGGSKTYDALGGSGGGESEREKN